MPTQPPLQSARHRCRAAPLPVLAPPTRTAVPTRVAGWRRSYSDPSLPAPAFVSFPAPAGTATRVMPRSRRAPSACSSPAPRSTRSRCAPSTGSRLPAAWHARLPGRCGAPYRGHARPSSSSKPLVPPLLPQPRPHKRACRTCPSPAAVSFGPGAQGGTETALVMPLDPHRTPVQRACGSRQARGP